MIRRFTRGEALFFHIVVFSGDNFRVTSSLMAAIIAVLSLL